MYCPTCNSNRCSVIQIQSEPDQVCTILVVTNIYIAELQPVQIKTCAQLLGTQHTLDCVHNDIHGHECGVCHARQCQRVGKPMLFDNSLPHLDRFDCR